MKFRIRRIKIREKFKKNQIVHSDNGNTSDSKPENEGSSPSAPAKSTDEKLEEEKETKKSVKWF